MARLPELNEATLSPEQKTVYDDIMRLRGRVRGPFAIWLRNAELADGALKLQELFASRVNTGAAPNPVDDSGGGALRRRRICLVHP